MVPSAAGPTTKQQSRLLSAKDFKLGLAPLAFRTGGAEEFHFPCTLRPPELPEFPVAV